MNDHRRALLKKKLGELHQICWAFNPAIQVHAKDTKGELVKKIIDREDEESKKPSSPSLLTAGTDDIGPPRPIFEEAAAGPERRGGPRPGAGRPLGMTDEKAAVKNLPKQPNMAIRQGLYVAGQAWAQSVKIPAVAFDDEETDLIALPLSQLQEYYFPGLIPEIAAVWVSLAYGLARVVKVRLDLIKEVQAARKEGKPVETIIGNKPTEETPAKEANGQAG
jgi:hypothetical protein